MKFNSKEFYNTLIKEEVDFYLRFANFDDRERTLFIFRNNKVPIERIAENMNCSVSTVNRINKTMIRKIIKSSEFYYPGISKEWN